MHDALTRNNIDSRNLAIEVVDGRLIMKMGNEQIRRLPVVDRDKWWSASSRGPIS